MCRGEDECGGQAGEGDAAHGRLRSKRRRISVRIRAATAGSRDSSSSFRCRAAAIRNPALFQQSWIIRRILRLTPAPSAAPMFAPASCLRSPGSVTTKSRQPRNDDVVVTLRSPLTTRRSPLTTCSKPSTASNPTHSIIVLHGLGADGNDFVPIVSQLVHADWPPLRFVFPHAPVRPVTVNNGMPMRAWYDIAGFDLSQRQDEAGVRASISQVEQLIAREEQRG